MSSSSTERSGLIGLIHRVFFAPVGERGSSFVRIFRYLVVGGIAWLVDYGMLMVLAKAVGAPLLVAATAGFVAGLAVNYGLSLTWVFGLRSFGIATFAVFLVTGVIGLVLNDLFLFALNIGAGLDLTLSKVITTILVLAWNYLGRLGLLRLLRNRRSSTSP